jgi:hypothetical protein
MRLRKEFSTSFTLLSYTIGKLQSEPTCTQLLCTYTFWMILASPSMKSKFRPVAIFLILGFETTFDTEVSDMSIICCHYNYCVSGYYPSSCFYLKHNVSETGFCLRFQVEPTQLSPIDRASPYRHIKFHMPIASVSLLIAIRLKAKYISYNRRVAALHFTPLPRAQPKSNTYQRTAITRAFRTPWYYWL